MANQPRERLQLVEILPNVAIQEECDRLDAEGCQDSLDPVASLVNVFSHLKGITFDAGRIKHQGLVAVEHVRGPNADTWNRQDAEFSPR
jgi:hypothetical protein